MATIAVYGAGSWGTALALVLAENGHEVHLWGHSATHMAELEVDRCNRRYLPEAAFPDTLKISSSLGQAANGANLHLVAVPSHAFRPFIESLRQVITGPSKIVWATKGLEPGTGLPLHRVVADVFGKTTPSAVLSGPSFAREVASGQPTAVTIASKASEYALELVNLFHNPRFRAYSSNDLVGVELGGAVKNVLAIAAGVADGLNFGANARAALITRGLAEMMRLGLKLGGKPETLMGLSGVGDLILTCTDNQSRNRRLGLGLGQGRSIETVKAEIGQEIEGIPTSHIVHALALNLRIEMPITHQVYRILFEGLPPREAVDNLLLREPKAEHGPAT